MFDSFIFAGFECSTGINAQRQAIDQIAATAHDVHMDSDYGLISDNGMRAVREGVRWPLVDAGQRYDFSSLAPFIAAAADHRLEVVWDLFHYGFPATLDLLSPEFPARFADYCHATASFIRTRSAGPWYFTPINEPSYFAWAAGEAGRFAPHLLGCGRKLKIALIGAAIRGIDAIRSAIPQARIVNADPLCHVVAPLHRDDLAHGVQHFNQVAVYESWDMLCGRSMPELGGSRSHLDVIGINYYEGNQWEVGSEDMPLSCHDRRRRPLGDLIRDAWSRYGGDLMITETSRAGEGRGEWIAHVADQVLPLIHSGIPLRGVCLYPVLGMPEWHDPSRWVAMGLWDIAHQDGSMRRIPYGPAIAALHVAEARCMSARSAFRSIAATASPALPVILHGTCSKALW